MAPTADDAPDRDREKRLQIYRAAEPLLERFGYRKTTVEEICRDAGMSKRTFYELFADKADLALQLLIHVAADIVGFYRESVRPDMGSFAKLDLFLAAYTRMAREHAIFDVLLRDADLMRSFGAHAHDPAFLEMVVLLQDVVGEGIARGEFRAMDPEAATLMVYSLLDSMHFLLPRYLDRPGALEDPALAAATADFIRHALRPVPADGRNGS